MDAAYWASIMRGVARRRDVEAFMVVFDHFGPRLKRYLTGLRAPDAVAEELVQDAMLRAWQRAEEFDPTRATLSTWLFRIARNLHIDKVRRDGHWTAAVEGVDALVEPVLEGRACAGEALVDEARLRRAIGSLPPAQARMIRMAYLESMTHVEIAKALGIPLGTVKSTLRRTFMHLQTSLQDTR
ncbi:sigma-70 family RNA polymerase sigma factor [Luteibacter yeojuensis]|nr:sigma-70 family RNA polymerase sigma factor [Luteibacter yeojuensis]